MSKVVGIIAVIALSTGTLVAQSNQPATKLANLQILCHEAHRISVTTSEVLNKTPVELWITDNGHKQDALVKDCVNNSRFLSQFEGQKFSQASPVGQLFKQLADAHISIEEVSSDYLFYTRVQEALK